MRARARAGARGRARGRLRLRLRLSPRRAAQRCRRLVRCALRLRSCACARPRLFGSPARALRSAFFCFGPLRCALGLCVACALRAARAARVCEFLRACLRARAAVPARPRPAARLAAGGCGIARLAAGGFGLTLRGLPRVGLVLLCAACRGWVWPYFARLAAGGFGLALGGRGGAWSGFVACAASRGWVWLCRFFGSLWGDMRGFCILLCMCAILLACANLQNFCRWVIWRLFWARFLPAFGPVFA